MVTVNGNTISFRDGRPVLPTGSPWQMPAQRTATPGMANQLSAAAQYQPGVGGLAPASGMAGQLSAAAQYGPGMGGLSGGADPWADGTIASMSGPQARAAYMDWNPFSDRPGYGRLQGGTLQDASLEAEQRAATLGARGGMAAQGSATAQYGLGPGLGRLSGGSGYGPANGPAPHPAQWAGVPGSEIANQNAWGPRSAGGMANQLGAAAHYQPGGSGLMARYAGGGGSPYQLPQGPPVGFGGFDPRYFAPIVDF
jgi:hypothetical protein